MSRSLSHQNIKPTAKTLHCPRDRPHAGKHVLATGDRIDDRGESTTFDHQSTNVPRIAVIARPPMTEYGKLIPDIRNFAPARGLNPSCSTERS
jgi:hypothetical protein